MSALEDLDDDLLRVIIEDEIATYIRTGLATMDTGTPDGLDGKTWSHAIYTARWSNLAEPWLPAVRACQRIRAAGLTADRVSS